MADLTEVGLTLDVDERANPSPDDLQFQDFSDARLLEDVGDTEINQLDSKMLDNEDDEDDDDDRELLSGKKKTPPFWSFEYYQQFFDVDSSQVGRRLIGSFIPSFGSNYLDTHIRPSPDLYGPFWVCATLIFTVAISEDMSEYFAHFPGKGTRSGTHFSLLNWAALIIIVYSWLIPSLLYSFNYWRGIATGQTYLELICIYGYALTPFIPASILCMIQNEWVKLVVLMVATGVSGFVLFNAIWGGLVKQDSKIAVITLICIVLLHIAFGVALFFFFPVPDIITPAHENITTAAAKIVTMDSSNLNGAAKSENGTVLQAHRL